MSSPLTTAEIDAAATLQEAVLAGDGAPNEQTLQSVRSAYTSIWAKHMDNHNSENPAPNPTDMRHQNVLLTACRQETHRMWVKLAEVDIELAEAQVEKAETLARAEAMERITEYTEAQNQQLEQTTEDAGTAE
jgi:hypothetical protein